MSGSRGKGRRGGGGRGGGRTAGNGGHGAVGQPQGGGSPQNPVEFYLYASEQFPMEQCPAQQKPAVVDGAIRLAMPIREHLGDIIAWFSAMAPADPSARLVVCQATKNDKAWLQAFVKEGFSTQLQYGEEADKHGNRLLQFSLLQPGSAAAAAAPPPPPAATKQEQPAAAAAGAQQPAAAAASKAKDAVANAAQQTKEATAEAGNKAGAVAAAAVDKAKDTAAAAVAKAQEAGKAASSSVAAAVQHANGAVGQGKAEDDGSNQDALMGKSGRNTQLMAVGGIALAVTTIVLGVVLGGKRKNRA